MFTINNLRIVNFIKYKEESIPLNNQGMILLKGDNRDEPSKGASGAGKTLIGDAVHWLLSGRTTRKIRADKVIGPFGKYCVVSAEIESDGCKAIVTRYRKHPKYGNSLRLESGSDVSHRTVEITEQRLEQMIGCSFELFRLARFQNSDAKYHFSRMDASSRAKILDEIIGTTEADIPYRLKTINRALRARQDDLRSVGDNKEATYSALESWRAELPKHNELLKSQVETYDQQLKKMREEIAELESGDISELDLRITKVNKSLDHFKEMRNLSDQIRDKDIELQASLARQNGRMTSIKDRISEFQSKIKTDIGSICFECGNTVTEDSIERLEKAKSERAKPMIKEYNQLKEKTECIKAEMQKLRKNTPFIDNNRERELIQERSDIEQQIKMIRFNFKKAKQKRIELDSFINQHEDQIQRIKSTVDQCYNRIAGYKEHITKLCVTEAKLNYDIHCLEYISNFYGPSGFRPLVMRHYSPILSEASNFFLSKFTNTNERISINSKTQLASGEVRDKIDIRVNSGNIEKAFPDEWSAGEGQAIDLSMNFGLMRLAQMKAGKEFGFMWLDECTSNLSPALVDKLFRILFDHLLAKNSTMIVTSHRPVDESMFDQIWTSVKENGVCSIQR